MCSTQSGSNSWKLQVRCSFQFPWCALTLGQFFLIRHLKYWGGSPCNHMKFNALHVGIFPSPEDCEGEQFYIWVNKVLATV
jgi:hypothetical protein